MEEDITNNLHQKFERIIARREKNKVNEGVASLLQKTESSNSQDTPGLEGELESIFSQYIVKKKENFYSALFKLERENELFLTEIKANTGIYKNAIINALINCLMNQETDRRNILGEIVCSKRNRIEQKDVVIRLFKVKLEYTNYLIKLKSNSRISRDLIINKTIEYCSRYNEFCAKVLEIAYKYHMKFVETRKMRESKE